MDLKGNDKGPLESGKNDPAQVIQTIMQSIYSHDDEAGRDFSGNVNRETVSGQVTFGGSITLQNELPEVHTFNDWLL